MTFMAKEEKLADRIIWDGIRILNRHYRVEAFIVARPDTICGVCSGWEHGEHSCAFPKHPRCALCADEHQCTVGTGRGMYCPHMVASMPTAGKTVAPTPASALKRRKRKRKPEDGGAG